MASGAKSASDVRSFFDSRLKKHPMLKEHILRIKDQVVAIA